MVNENIINKEEESKLGDIIPLIDEPYTYENMVNNPIIKPISETDRSLRDLDDMVYKKMIDIKKLKEKVNATITDVPSYQDSSFVSDLIRLTQGMDDIIKLQDIQFTNTKECIKKIAHEVKERYYVKIEGGEDYAEPTTVIPEGSVPNYIDKICSDSNEMVSEIAQKIKEIFSGTIKGRNDKEKFENAGVEYYSKELDKEKRKIAAKIIRMEI